MTEKRIVCAAIRLSEGLIICGPRHFDTTMYGTIQAMDEELKTGAKRAEQGFIDQFGEFYDRREAWEIAERAGQIIRRCGGDGPELIGLFSENLY